MACEELRNFFYELFVEHEDKERAEKKNKALQDKNQQAFIYMSDNFYTHILTYIGVKIDGWLGKQYGLYPQESPINRDYFEGTIAEIAAGRKR